MIEKTESGWWRGDLRGTVGLFPSNYVKVVSSSQPNSALNTNNPYEDEEYEEEEEVSGQKPVARARALYEYQATTSHELSLYPDQVISVFSKLDNGWWQGEVEGRIGHFPSTYVEEIPLEEPSTNNADFLKRTQSGTNRLDVLSRVNCLCRRATSRGGSGSRTGSKGPSTLRVQGQDRPRVDIRAGRRVDRAQEVRQWLVAGRIQRQDRTLPGQLCQGG